MCIRDRLNIFAGGSGAGKSLFLANLGVNFAQKGMNVLYLSLELSEALVSMRVDSMVTEISTRDIFKQIDDVEMKVKIIGKKSGAFQVKYMPSGKTPNDVRSYIKEYEIKTKTESFSMIKLSDYKQTFMELVFVILAAGTSAKLALKTVNILAKDDFVINASLSQIISKLRHIKKPFLSSWLTTILVTVL